MANFPVNQYELPPATTMRASSVKASSMEAAKAGPAPEPMGSRNPTMAETTEGAGVRGRCVGAP
jgi:hypothetical protein